MLNCGLCKEKTAVFRAYDIQKYLCDDCFDKKIESIIKRIIKKYKMFNKKNKIAVAVSGGKDSLGLIYILNKLGYNVTGFYIALGIENSRYSEISEEKTVNFCKKNNIDLNIINIKNDYGISVDELKHKKRKTCSVCGIVKRYLMNKIPMEQGYDVLCTGHNLDDEVGVLFSNNLRWDLEYLIRQYPVLEKRDGFIKKVKPLVGIYEREMAFLCLLKGIDYIRNECPYSAGATIIEWKEMWNNLELNHTGLKKQYLNIFYDTFKSNIKDEKKIIKLNKCSECGMITSNPDTCNFCKLKNGDGSNKILTDNIGINIKT